MAGRAERGILTDGEREREREERERERDAERTKQAVRNTDWGGSEGLSDGCVPVVRDRTVRWCSTSVDGWGLI